MFNTTRMSTKDLFDLNKPFQKAALNDHLNHIRETPVKVKERKPSAHSIGYQLKHDNRAKREREALLKTIKPSPTSNAVTMSFTSSPKKENAPIYDWMAGARALAKIEAEELETETEAASEYTEIEDSYAEESSDDSETTIEPVSPQFHISPDDSEDSTEESPVPRVESIYEDSDIQQVTEVRGGVLYVKPKPKPKRVRKKAVHVVNEPETVYEEDIANLMPSCQNPQHSITVVEPYLKDGPLNRFGRLKAHHKDKVRCELCGSIYGRASGTLHRKTQKHQMAVKIARRDVEMVQAIRGCRSRKDLQRYIESLHEKLDEPDSV